jgi:hypothetical protein
MKQDFSKLYGDPLTIKPTPREHYFAEDKNEKIIINKIVMAGFVYWRTEWNHWVVPLGNLTKKEVAREPNFSMAPCYKYREEGEEEVKKADKKVTTKVKKKKKEAATAA